MMNTLNLNEGEKAVWNKLRMRINYAIIGQDATRN